MSKNPRQSFSNSLPHTNNRPQFHQAANYNHNYQPNHPTQYQIPPAQNFRFNQPPPPPLTPPVSQNFGYAIPPPTTFNPAPEDLGTQQPTESSLEGEHVQQQLQPLLLNQVENSDNPAAADINPAEQGTGTSA